MAIKSQELPLTMLKVSANRLSDESLIDMCGHKTHPLAVLDLSGNNVTGIGARKLRDVLLHKKHKSQLHSVNLANNGIASEGVISLVSCLGKSSLLSLNVCSQTCSYGGYGKNI
jgi:Ran GTPase-activating protein (RanGAP) involved in mRNA processing and transport